MEFWKCKALWGCFRSKPDILRLHVKCHWQLNNSFLEGIWEQNDLEFPAFIVLKWFCQVLVVNICVHVFVCLSVSVCFTACYTVRNKTIQMKYLCKWTTLCIYICKYLGSMWIIKMIWYLSEKLPLVFFLFSPFCFYLCFSFYDVVSHLMEKSVY